jgi:putative transposase
VVTLIQRFGSAANLNIHLHCLVLDGVYLNRDGVPVFHEAAAPSTDELEAVLLKLIMRTMRLLTRLGALIEEPDRTYPAETETDGALRSLQAASCTYRIALGPRAGQKVLSLQSLPSAARPSAPELRVNAQGFSLHAAPISVQNSRSSAAISPGQPSPTNGSNVIAPAKLCCN